MGGRTTKEPEPKAGRTFIALFDYESRTDEDLDFKAGDHLIILDDMEFDWWMAKNKQSSKSGYIPSNFVAKLGSIECQP